MVSHYRVISKLGAGGMGEVWVGIDETLRRKVAMKAIRKDRRLDRLAKTRFLREARILSQLDHPNICRVYDYIDSETRDWLVLELIDGDTLRAAIARGMTAAERLRVALAIADVLVAMHAAGVMHRDLKPTNVMLTPRGEPKVLDFGLSAVGAAPESDEEPAGTGSGSSIDLGVPLMHSAPGTMVGTLAYMSPEQMAGDPATTASDMCAFGIVLEEMYTAHAPQGAAPYPLGTPSPPPVPRAIKTLIERLRATAPAQRPTAIDALTSLRAIADAPKRRRRQLLAAAAITIAIAGALKYTWDLSRERTAAIAARDEADRRRQQAESLIGFMVGDLRTRLTAVGRLEILDDVGKKALEYFDAVPGATLTGEELFRRSQTMQQLGQVRQARADAAAAKAAYQESLALAEQVVKSDPNNAKWQLGLGSSHFYVGEMMRRAGDLDGALAHFRDYQDIARKLVERDPGNAEFKLELSYGYSNVAAILSGQGKLDEARRQLELTRDIQTEIARIRPDDTAIQTSRANNFDRLGVMLVRLGKLNEAVESFRNELEIYQRLVDRDPSNTQFRRRMPTAYAFYAQALRVTGDDAGAEAAYLKSHTVAAELAQHDPANADWQRELALAEMNVGIASLSAGRTAQAAANFQSSIRIWQQRMERNRDLARRSDLSAGEAHLAEALLARGDTSGARRHGDLAVEAIDEQTVQTSEDPRVRRLLGFALNVRGAARYAAGDRAGAREDWQRVVALLEPWANERDFYVLEPLARAQIRLGDVDRARPIVERLTASGYREREFMALWTEHAGNKQ